MEVAGKVVVVTGAGHGIGEEMARRFVAEGARTVVVSDIDDDNLARVADTIGQPSRHCDVSDGAEYEAFLDWIEADVGPIDLLCNHPALIAGPEGGNFQTTDETLDRSWATNVMPHIRSARQLVPRMLERGGGYFLHTITAGALLTLESPLSYSTTKYAALGFAEWLALNYGDRGIRVSCICPSFVDTRPGAQAVPGVAMVPSIVADAVIEGLADERFLILPNPAVGRSFTRKGENYDSWLAHTRARITPRRPAGPWDDRFPPPPPPAG
jgi:NAD(P)-dependent dehydrogenase (short-subunit alcohol dehydrogenase family)